MNDIRSEMHHVRFVSHTDSAHIDIILDDATHHLARLLGKWRYQSNTKHKVVEQKRGDGDPMQYNVDGVAAELAIAAYYNLYPDLSVQPRRGGWDLLMGSMRIDVKHTRRADGRLICPVKEHRKYDDVEAFLCVTGVSPNLKYVGWASAQELIRPATIREFGKGPTYAIDQQHLHAPKSFIEHVYATT